MRAKWPIYVLLPVAAVCASFALYHRAACSAQVLKPVIEAAPAAPMSAAPAQSGPAATTAAVDEAKYAVAGVYDNYSKVVSGDLTVRETIYKIPSPLPDTILSVASEQVQLKLEHHLVFNGSKYKKTEWDVHGGSKTIETEKSGDGSTGLVWIPGNKTAELRSGKNDGMPGSLVAHNLGLLGDFDAKCSPQYEEMLGSHVVSGGHESIDGVDCIKLVGDEFHGNKRTWWVAPSYGYAIVKYVTFLNPDPSRAISSAIEEKSSNFEQLGEGGPWLPQRLEKTVVWTLADGTTSGFVLDDMDVSYTGINAPVQAEDLHVDLPSDVKVIPK